MEYDRSIKKQKGGGFFPANTNFRSNINERSETSFALPQITKSTDRMNRLERDHAEAQVLFNKLDKEMSKLRPNHISKDKMYKRGDIFMWRGMSPKKLIQSKF